MAIQYGKYGPKPSLLSSARSVEILVEKCIFFSLHLYLISISISIMNLYSPSLQSLNATVKGDTIGILQ